MASVLLIEDDVMLNQSICAALKHADHEVHSLFDGRAWHDKVSQTQIDLIITDMYMPEKDGLETIREIRENGYDIPVLAISGGSSVARFDALKLAKNMGANEVLNKPFGFELLRNHIDSLLAGT